MKRYEPKAIEPKWQKIWEEQGLYHADDASSKPKIYATPMLPYPSGAGLHIGHVRNYSISDAVARYYRQRGYNVLSTIAWDAFGLPAENYAIKTGTPPAESTAKNIAYFKQQVQRVGMSVDWTREFNTSDPSYYKWTQWLFSFMYKRGLAYQAEKSQWWCDQCKTVLADEQVIAGKCWRHDSADDPLVTKKSLNQWFFKITDYADEILAATDSLDWPEKIKTMQKNWIGRSQGAEVSFQVDGFKESVVVYTTRVDTLYGATFLVIAPEHEIAELITTDEQKAAVQDYIAAAARKSDIERQADKSKTGIFSGRYAIHPLTKEKIPIWIADYVLTGYGTGAIMAVPAHDERDNEFALKYNLPIVQVVAWAEDDAHNPPKQELEMVNRDTVIVHLRDKSTGKFALLNWHGSLEGITTAIMGGIEEGQTPEQAALTEIQEEAALSNVRIVSQTRWLTISRYCASHKQQNRTAITHAFLAEVDNLDEQGARDKEEAELHTLIWVNKDDIENTLTPDHQKYVWRQLWDETVYVDEGEMINSGPYSGMTSSAAREKITADLAKQSIASEKTKYKIRDWLISRQRYWGAPIPIIHCEEHGAVLVPDSELPVVLPTVEKFAPDGSNHSILAAQADWVNVPCPTCGKPAKRETDTMDGYVCSTWYLHRYTDAHNDEAAFSSDKANYWFPLDFYFGGDHAVAHLLYIRFLQRVFVDAGIMSPHTIEPVKKLVYNGYINAEDGSKMSKSKGNTVDPMEVIDAGYGADALRVFELFIAPYDQDTPWSSSGVPGTYRFLNRMWVLTQEFSESTASSDENNEELLRAVHKAIAKVTKDLDSLSFNTAVSAMMECVNTLYKLKQAHGFNPTDEWRFALECLVQLLAPFAPHIAEELWQQLGHNDSVHIDHWPQADERYLQSDTMTLAVQVNGKVRAEITVPTDMGEDEIKAEALTQENVANHLHGNEPKKIIYVTSRLVSIVV